MTSHVPQLQPVLLPQRTLMYSCVITCLWSTSPLGSRCYESRGYSYFIYCIPMHSLQFPWFWFNYSSDIFEGTIAPREYDLSQEGLWSFIHCLHRFAFQTCASVPTIVLPRLPCPLSPYSGQKKGPRFHKVSCFLLVKAYGNSTWQSHHHLQTDSRIRRLPISIPESAAREVVDQNIYRRALSEMVGGLLGSISQLGGRWEPSLFPSR